MSSAEYLKVFINDRLTVAAAEIFGALKNIIVKYEEEIDRQRRLLEIKKSDIKLNRIVAADFPQQHVCKEEEVLADQQLYNQERNSSIYQDDSEPPQMKEEQEELCISQEEEQLVVKQETNDFMLTPYEKNYHNNDQTLPLNPDEPLSAEQRKSAVNMLVISSAGGAPTRDHQLSNNPQDQKGDMYGDFKFKSKIPFKMNTGERPHVCQTCGKDFKTRRVLSVHTRIHTGERPYTCQTCGKDFKTMNVFTIHMRIHTGEKPYLCKVCGKGFTNRNSLTVHMRVHTGERPYVCQTCGKDFKTRSALSVHMRLHTGERPYSCSTCGKEFRQGQHLNLHMRTFHNNGKSNLCKTL